jgi:outer membrane biosynthesis protein TonB
VQPSFVWCFLLPKKQLKKQNKTKQQQKKKKKKTKKKQKKKKQANQQRNKKQSLPTFCRSPFGLLDCLPLPECAMPRGDLRGSNDEDREERESI